MICCLGFTMLAKPTTDNEIKALYIYNFTKYIKWPEARQGQDKFIIGVIGESPVIPELKKIAATRKVAQSDIIIKQFSNDEDLSFCHILFLPFAQSDKVASAAKYASGHNTLIITEKTGLAKKGAGINFVTLDEKLQFEINILRLMKSGLEVSSDLEPLGIIVLD